MLPRKGKLGRLHLGQNNITQINRLNIQYLLEQSTTLFELHLQGNQLTDLPAELAYLFQLKVLDVSNNSIANVPAPLGYMKSLQRCGINSLSVLPHHAMSLYLKFPLFL